MVPTVDIAPALFHQLVDVKRSMQQLQLSPSKTEEVITAYILNQWWAEQGLPYSIAIATPPTGYDGLLKVNGQVPEGQTMAVEFKSAQKKGDGNCGFQFNPDPAKFVFTDHACIACTGFEQGWPVRIFVALAPFGERRCMQALQQVLLSDGNGRSSYNPDSRAQLNLWSRGKAATAVRQQPTLGLEDCQQWQTWSADDRMDILDAATIARFMNI